MPHPIGHGDEDHGLAVWGQTFVVLGESSVFAQPSEGAFDDPSFRQDDEPADGVAFDDLDEPPVPSANPVHELSGVSAIGKDQLHSTKARAKLLHDPPTAIAVLKVGRMDHQGHDQAQRVDDQMSLAALDLLARVVPAVPPFSAVLTD